MANTTYSDQVAIHKIAGVTAVTGKHPNVQLNTTNGSTGLSWQEMLNVNAGNAKTAKSPQELLFNKVKTALSLSGPYTQYSEQYLLNKAFTNGTITALNLVNK
jgi:hypothetical protein